MPVGNPVGLPRNRQLERDWSIWAGGRQSRDGKLWTQFVTTEWSATWRFLHKSKNSLQHCIQFSYILQQPTHKKGKMFTSKPLLRIEYDQWASVLCPLCQIWAACDTQPSPWWRLQTTSFASFPFFFLTWLLTSCMPSGPKLLPKLLFKPSGSVVSSGFSYQLKVQSCGTLVSHFSELPILCLWSFLNHSVDASCVCFIFHVRMSQGHSIVQLLRVAHTAEQRGLLCWGHYRQCLYPQGIT